MGDRLGIHGAVDILLFLAQINLFGRRRKNPPTTSLKVRGEPPLDLAFYLVRQFHLVFSFLCCGREIAVSFSSTLTRQMAASCRDIAGGGFSLSAPGRLCSQAPPGLGPETSWPPAGGAHSGAPTEPFDKLRGFSVEMHPRLSSGIGPIQTE